MLVNAVCNRSYGLWAAVAWYILLFVAGLLPDRLELDDSLEIPHLDKIAHFVSYGIWGCLIFIGRSTPLWCLPLAIVLAALQEATHYYHPERSFEWADLVANVSGITLGLLITRVIHKRYAYGAES